MLEDLQKQRFVRKAKNANGCCWCLQQGVIPLCSWLRKFLNKDPHFLTFSVLFHENPTVQTVSSNSFKKKVSYGNEWIFSRWPSPAISSSKKIWFFQMTWALYFVMANLALFLLSLLGIFLALVFLYTRNSAQLPIVQKRGPCSFLWLCLKI